ncbi:MAG: glycogen synthase [Polyangiaceae bacterium]|nr:glycogen synthase [Polyangiaceae bacterium]
MRVALVTREYPPEVYGGAGVHVEHLAAELRAWVDLRVHCFGAPREGANVRAHRVELVDSGVSALEGPAPHLAALRTVAHDVAIAACLHGAEIVHSHTWYANLAGHLAKLVHGARHVMTSHSLEPLRPWKREQLAGGYELSSFCERVAIEAADAVIAVSEGMRADILRAYPQVDPGRVVVIHNGVDPSVFSPDPGREVLAAHGLEPGYALFVGRVTRQKGILHLVHAARHLPTSAHLVLCAGDPDTPAMAAELRRALAAAQGGARLTVIEGMLPRAALVQLVSHAAVFVCPSVYEPFGIVNLEAMGCGVPVVASRVGGIPEVVAHGETGWLVDLEADGTASGEPRDPEAFARGLAAAIARVLADPAGARELGRQGRRRVEERFTWAAVARETAALYRRVAAERGGALRAPARADP